MTFYNKKSIWCIYYYQLKLSKNEHCKLAGISVSTLSLIVRQSVAYIYSASLGGDPSIWDNLDVFLYAVHFLFAIPYTAYTTDMWVGEKFFDTYLISHILIVLKIAKLCWLWPWPNVGINCQNSSTKPINKPVVVEGGGV